MSDHLTFARYPGETARIIFAPIFIGLARGYFKDRGLELTISEPAGHPWASVADGSADAGVGFIDYCTDPKFAGHMKAVAVHEQFYPGHGLTSLLARRELIESGALSDYASLRGKTIGLAPGRGDDYMAFYGALTQGGLTIEDVNVVDAAHGERSGAERVDLLIGRRPRGVAAEVASGHLAVWKVGDEVNPNLQARYILFSEPYMQGRREVGVRFLAAYLHGARDFCDAFNRGIGRGELIALLQRETGETRDLLETMKPIGFTANGSIDVPRMLQDVDVLIARGLMPAGVPLADIVDTTFVEAALNQIGPYPG